jgi:hypothetical protein
MPTCGLYVAMSYLYGVRFTAEEDHLVLSLRTVGCPMKYKLEPKFNTIFRNSILKITTRSTGLGSGTMSPAPTYFVPPPRFTTFYP